MTTVAVFVGTRADFSPLQPVITALATEPDLDTHLLTGLAFSSDELRRDPALSGLELGFHDVSPPILTLTPDSVVEHGAEMVRGAAAVIETVRPDVLILLGDRWELLWIASTAYLAGVRIVHLHGGEVTEGAIDDRVRHALTKLADQHCVASQDAADRLRQMGEPADRVHLTGAPGIDRLKTARPLSQAELTGVLARTVTRPLTIFTYHPCAGTRGAAARYAAEALRGTIATTGSGTVVVTHPGMDDEREEVLSALLGVAETEPSVVVVKSLGVDYPRVLASSDLVVGNSSAGIIEAATFGVPVVDIGVRQTGRLRAENVIHSAEGADAVASAVASALSPAFRSRAATVENPYGSGRSASQIVHVVRQTPPVSRLKEFADKEASG